MKSVKPQPESPFPDIIVPLLSGGEIALGKAAKPENWQMVVVYRGKHCPLCTRYLNELEAVVPQLAELGVEVVAVSADPQERAMTHLAEIPHSFPVGFDLSIEQMQQLGLYISHPRSPEESDRPFAEPGLFVVNEEGHLQIVDLSNIPFARPDLNAMVQGIGFVRNPANNYPIRGTFA
ncbi:redoxin domain-containing protein [Erythrobacter sp. F6033]|uniref:redoxin domain-containing protein n=1 Tax=Erythrobacter sp. F6033 TaxID=2926401 RepID=UPI001FF47B66|nr:redoxin domain-containing protein [Erythrobacter sp. F6033]MCK0128859.1 redoxin family protein [Erythrobacter sp. F6033]